MILVRIRYRERQGARKVLSFALQVENPLEAIQAFYKEHPQAVWVGCRSIPNGEKTRQTNKLYSLQ